MNLTYEATETGYTIFNNGKAWIVQSNYIPYPGETMDESVQNHIDQILAEQNTPPIPTTEDELAEVKAANEILAESLIEFKMAYMDVPCQLHQEYPVIVEGLIEEAKTDGTV